MKLLPLVLLLLSPSLLAGGIRSYIDENGVLVLTNLGSRRGPVASISTIEPTAAGSNFIPLIRDYSTRYGLDEKLVQAIIQVESDFDPTAVSAKDCKGLMQLHPDTARRFGVADVFNPAENIEGGVRYLSYLMSSFDGRLDHVLAAYNAGENAVKRYSGVPPYKETQEYIQKVKRLFQPQPSPTLATRAAQRPNRVYAIRDSGGGLLLTNTP